MYTYHCLNNISEAGLKNFTADYVQKDDTDADAILVRSANMKEMEFSDNLKAIARAGAGVNNIPLDVCAEKGIVVFNTPGANANGVKELVIAGMLLASRDIVGGIEWLEKQESTDDIAKKVEKQKKQFAGHEISGKKLGIIGLGAIGVMVANTAVSLGMDVYGYDPYISVSAAWNLSRAIRHVNTLDEIYANCDYITVHVPLTSETKGMINAEAIEKMKDGVVILNFARDALAEEN
ncbi:MAG: 3-phosphoglycerate dehydrogenase, partial [Lachnospiraceae bacterium]|nr:3-phosphoglycerate dehydrogenase [Lachnospiraceae bacterium]